MWNKYSLNDVSKIFHIYLLVSDEVIAGDACTELIGADEPPSSGKSC